MANIHLSTDQKVINIFLSSTGHLLEIPQFIAESSSSDKKLSVVDFVVVVAVVTVVVVPTLTFFSNLTFDIRTKVVVSSSSSKASSHFSIFLLHTLCLYEILKVNFEMRFFSEATVKFLTR